MSLNSAVLFKTSCKNPFFAHFENTSPAMFLQAISRGPPAQDRHPKDCRSSITRQSCPAEKPVPEEGVNALHGDSPGTSRSPCAPPISNTLLQTLLIFSPRNKNHDDLKWKSIVIH